MPSAGVVQVVGLKQLRRTLHKAGVDLGDFTVVNRAAASIVAAVARSRTPIGPDAGGHISGTVRVGATRTAGIIRVGNNTRFRYAGPIHWGWPARNIPPNPWVSDAAQDTESQWLPKYIDGVDAIVSQVKGA